MNNSPPDHLHSKKSDDNIEIHDFIPTLLESFKRTCDEKSYREMMKMLEFIDFTIVPKNNAFFYEYINFRDTAKSKDISLLINCLYYYIWLHKSLVISAKKTNVALKINNEAYFGEDVVKRDEMLVDEAKFIKNNNINNVSDFVINRPSENKIKNKEELREKSVSRVRDKSQTRVNGAASEDLERKVREEKKRDDHRDKSQQRSYEKTRDKSVSKIKPNSDATPTLLKKDKKVAEREKKSAHKKRSESPNFPTQSEQGNTNNNNDNANHSPAQKDFLNKKRTKKDTKEPITLTNKNNKKIREDETPSQTEANTPVQFENASKKSNKISSQEVTDMMNNDETYNLIMKYLHNLREKDSLDNLKKLIDKKNVKKIEEIMAGNIKDNVSLDLYTTNNYKIIFVTADNRYYIRKAIL
jgi:hypothetical protein